MQVLYIHILQTSVCVARSMKFMEMQAFTAAICQILSCSIYSGVSRYVDVSVSWLRYVGEGHEKVSCTFNWQF